MTDGVKRRAAPRAVPGNGKGPAVAGPSGEGGGRHFRRGRRSGHISSKAAMSSAAPAPIMPFTLIGCRLMVLVAAADQDVGGDAAADLDLAGAAHIGALELVRRGEVPSRGR